MQAPGRSPAEILLHRARHTEEIESLLPRCGRILGRFERQDSGNVSYGLECAGLRLFVKTAGPLRPVGSAPPRAERVAALRRLARLQRRFRHPALPMLRNALEIPSGPALVFDWAAGELLHVPRALRADPSSAFARFRALPAERIARALDAVYDLHRVLARGGVVASDFYDGSLIYDFASDRVHVCDLDEYREGPFELERERNFGSTRFMAPEEFRRGSRIDQRTNVFTLARAAFELLGDGSLDPAAFRGSDALHAVALRGCEPERDLRYAGVAEFEAAWRRARAAG
jgi:serine/threonine-protein kinase